MPNWNQTPAHHLPDAAGARLLPDDPDDRLRRDVVAFSEIWTRKQLEMLDQFSGGSFQGIASAHFTISRPCLSSLEIFP